MPDTPYIYFYKTFRKNIFLKNNIFARSALTFESAKLDWPKSVLLRLFRPKSNCFLGRGYGGVDTARRRWRFDTSIFRISKVDPSTNTLAMGTNMFRDPFLDQFFGNFLNLWKPPNWRSWRHDRNKSAIWGFFGDNSQCIYDQCILCFWPFLNNQLRFALLPCTVYLVNNSASRSTKPTGLVRFSPVGWPPGLVRFYHFLQTAFYQPNYI